MVNNIKIDFRTKQLTDEELTLKFLSALFDTYEYLKNNEVSITLLKNRKSTKFKTNPNNRDISLFKSEDNNKTWKPYTTHRHIKIEYVNRQSDGWESPGFSTKCETSINFSGFYYDINKEKLDKIFKGEDVHEICMKQFKIYLQFIKFISKNNRKRLINHLYYMDNHKGTEYRKFKTFINGYLSKLNVSMGDKMIHRIDFYRSFSEIRNQRLDQILSNKKGIYESKLKDSESNLCKRLSTFFEKNRER